MATLTVWAFDDANHAKEALKRIRSVAKQGVLELEDAAIVSWPVGAKRPKTQQLQSLAGAGAVGGAFWGMLFGVLFLVPIAGALVGAAAGAAGGALSDIGIDDDFIKDVRSRVSEGTSALFVMSHDVVLDKVQDLFQGMNVELVQTNLSEAEELQLKEHFQLVE